MTVSGKLREKGQAYLPFSLGLLLPDFSVPGAPMEVDQRVVSVDKNGMDSCPTAKVSPRTYVRWHHDHNSMRVMTQACLYRHCFYMLCLIQAELDGPGNRFSLKKPRYTRGLSPPASDLEKSPSPLVRFECEHSFHELGFGCQWRRSRLIFRR